MVRGDAGMLAVIHNSNVIIIIMNLDFLESLRMRLEDLQENDPHSAELIEDDREAEECHDYRINIDLDKEGRVVLKSSHIQIEDFIIGPTLGTGSYGRVKQVRLKARP